MGQRIDSKVRFTNAPDDVLPLSTTDGRRPNTDPELWGAAWRWQAQVQASLPGTRRRGGRAGGR